MDSELFKIILTSSLTVIGGVIVFVSGQLASKFFIDPIHAQDKLLGDIANLLIMYAKLTNDNNNPPAQDSNQWREIVKASNRLRQKASQLTAASYQIRAYRLFWLARIIRLNKKKVKTISRNLIGWSNFIISGDSQLVIKAQDKIGSILKVDV